MSENIEPNETEEPLSGADAPDLSVDATAFAAPGDGDAGEGGDVQSYYTYGTTCWGTPCTGG